MKKCFLWGRKWIVFGGWQSLNPTPVSVPNQTAPIYWSVMQWDKCLKGSESILKQYGLMSFLAIMENTALQHVPKVQSDTAPPLFSHCVCTFWGGPILSSPHSPDLTPLTYFSWGNVKDIVYREKVQNVNKLCDRIVRAAECITNEMLTNTWQETEYHVDVCHVTNGVHSEICWAIRNFERSSVWKYIGFWNTVYGWKYIIFYFITI